MALFDRLGTVVRSEWNARFGEEDDSVGDDEERDDEGGETSRTESSRAARQPIKKGGRPQGKTRAAARPPSRRAHQVDDVKSAWNVLELQPGATLDVVRESYFAHARRYHPRTLSKNADQAYAAQTVLDALTDALELLEAHLLPLSDGREG